jgi:hypothetical protein
MAAMRILVTGSATPARIAQIMDAAVDRLDLTEVAVLAGDDADAPVTGWCDRRWTLYRFHRDPLDIDIHLVFPGYSGAEWGRVIRC